MATIAIIGTGLAGMALAAQLQKNGHACVMFEKSDEFGGRLATHQMEDWQADFGTQYFTARSKLFTEEVTRWQQQGWVSQWHVEPWSLERETYELSPDEQQRFVGMPKMNAMIRGLSDGITTYFETRIDRLERIEQKWRLWDEYGEHYGAFDAVFITAPLAQTLALLPEDSIAEVSLRMATMTPTWSYALALSEPSGISADALFSSNGIVTWAAKDSSKPGRPTEFETWTIHFDGRWSANHLDASQQLLSQQVVHLLERLSGRKLPTIHGSFMHKWLYARSSGVGAELHQWDADKRIGLAGDWTLGSRLEDAWMSAHIVAEQALPDLV